VIDIFICIKKIYSGNIRFSIYEVKVYAGKSGSNGFCASGRIISLTTGFWNV